MTDEKKIEDTWSLKNKEKKIDKDFYFDNQFSIIDVSKWDYIRDQIKDGYYPEGHQFVGCMKEESDWFKKRLMFFWKDDIEVFRQKIIEDLNVLDERTHDREYNWLSDVLKIINKRFGVEK